MTDAFLIVKTLHVVSAAVLLGAGIGIAFFCGFGTRHALARNDIAVLRMVLRFTVVADSVFTAPAVVIQLATGWWLMQALGWRLGSPWALAVFSLFALVGLCWLPVVGIQARLSRMANAAPSVRELPVRFRTLLRVWFALGIPAFAAVVGIVFLMVARPLAVAYAPPGPRAHLAEIQGGVPALPAFRHPEARVRARHCHA